MSNTDDETSTLFRDSILNYFTSKRNVIKLLSDKLDGLELLETDESVEKYLEGCEYPCNCNFTNVNAEFDLKPIRLNTQHVKNQDSISNVSSLFERTSEDYKMKIQEEFENVSICTDYGNEPLQEFQDAVMACVTYPIWYINNEDDVGDYIADLVEYYEPLVGDLELMEEILKVFMVFGQEYHILNSEWFYSFELDTFFKIVV
ncbi:hypothetical protein TPHA_0P00740 [Tetrapisispora phaffii CBS 4417]|uniref:Uncharacterized protein n=1 Tax=Tetrapisispora phaffii (strain ATCC 24235 / CBS 4417 / NBRC 1672 / NRRL Y-8282 / UCD 70-5) TaxID=1071381 RepID=G8C254_TETPH|nr:hypothetical protein TPHA_0P00740 [Tetrapisispora phaffii CBS 4417]CCE66232.1 hypothetical protein TPHA_0P00740 [Tetrapisispora phaffii CBS 4417]